VVREVRAAKAVTVKTSSGALEVALYRLWERAQVSLVCGVRAGADVDRQWKKVSGTLRRRHVTRARGLTESRTATSSGRSRD